MFRIAILLAALMLLLSLGRADAQFSGGEWWRRMPGAAALGRHLYVHDRHKRLRDLVQWGREQRVCLGWRRHDELRLGWRRHDCIVGD